ncbi:MAG TPA: YbhB/YbcL family Raf kinase inhibitor-like protein [Terriglobia bacterium]|nr:YbhB/YbcL family Raf kinase inhibitor-like protein [Terriglobia bacterium]
MRFLRRAAGLIFAAGLLGLAVPGSGAAGPREQSATLTVSSPSFAPGSAIPREFTCEGSDSSPALHWTNPPSGTKSLALIMDDPDAPAGTWVHWVVFNIPAEARELPADTAKDGELPNGARQGQNSFERLGYGGPCPPPGSAHRYLFKVYALDSKLDLRSGSSKAELENAMKDHTLARGDLMGRYKRSR